jgi:hypothetical protein
MMNLISETNEKTIFALENLTYEMKRTAYKPCLDALALPIETRAKDLAPSSKKSGDRYKWGKNVTRTFNPESMKKHDSGKHVAHKNLLRSDIGPMTIIGPKYSEGIKQQFNNSPNGRRVWYWGIDTLDHRPVDNPRFIDKARDEMLSVSVSNFVSELERQLETIFSRM